jgi:uncharacterized cupin superfamily protein
MERSNARYQSLVGASQGAKKIHMHVTELDPAGDGWGRQHAHAAEEAMFILEGEAEFTFGGKTYRVGPGDAVFFPSGVMHAESRFFTDRMKYVVVRSVESGDDPCCCEGD